MELKVKIEVSYIELFCDNCGFIVYSDGYIGDNEIVVSDIDTPNFEQECERCGCKYNWKTLIHYTITK